MSESHREALAHLLYGINSDGCLVLLTGDVGIGKTTICRCLLEQLPKTTDVALVFNPKLSAEELVRAICEELMILPELENPSNKDYIDRLNRHLLDAHSKGRTTALIIDEAQNLEPEVLEQLRLLTNLETNTHKLLRIILIGQPELRDILEHEKLSQVNQRITSRYHITALQPDDINNYIHHRLSVAGNETGRLFSAKAIGYIVKYTNGIPRLINLLCDRALLGAYAENSDHVDIRIIKRAGEEIFTEPPPRPAFFKNSFFRLSLLLPIALCFVAFVYYIGIPFNTGKRGATPLVNQTTHQEQTVQAATPGKEEAGESRPSRINITPPVRLPALSEFIFNEEEPQAAE
ncbi:ExeA family protein [Desulfopila sp. IMCC35008]|uniref:ExeA family protein n=1 Tax=Desulfopila sp. IMCC35008 TaxID=2653858 RepID=UPI00197ACB30|nr:AAA family ATPase [Desulfopila sp. IMCC35008]